MLVVHGCWVPGALPAAPPSSPAGVGPGWLALWAEDSAAEPPPRRRGRAPAVRPHPFAAGTEGIRAALGPASVGASVATVTVTLPTAGSSPVASPELVRDEIVGSTGDVSAASWYVPALACDADLAVDLFAEIRGSGESDGAAAIWGTSVTHLAAMAGFAVELVARGRVLPGIESGPVVPPAEASQPRARPGVMAASPEATRARAIWRPVLTGADAAWARALAQSAPPPLFAAAPDGGHGLWAGLLDALVDAATRAALGHARLATARHPSDPTARAWLTALTGRQREFGADAADLAELTRGLGQWQADAVAGPVRACFRLVEPAEGEADWQVRFGLQAADEPGLVVEAERVWRARGTLTALARHVDSPQETFLAELGKAARLYPELDDALRTARPAVLGLDAEGAHRFLSTAAPTLATAGFGVQLPGWWTKPSSRLGLKLAASTPGQPGRVEKAASAVGLDAIAQFTYQLVVGGQTLTDDELAELAASKASLVRLRGQWIELDARRLAAGLKLMGRQQQGTLADLMRIGLGVDADPDGLPVEGISADGWLGDLLADGAEQRLKRVPTPRSFTGTLRPYQSRGLAWLDFLQRCGLGGILADDMGLGKTVQLLALLARDGSGTEPTLLVCPMSLVGNWQREAARFAPTLRVHVHHGSERARGKEFAQAVAGVGMVVTTYALAARDAADLRKITWRRVVVDEAQAIKNAATKQATAIRSIPASTRIAVTGTPVENRLADLWSILEFANPGMLGSAASFKKRYAEPIERGGDADAAARLRRFTAPFLLRRLKTDRSIIADLPDKLEMDVLCNLTAEQAALYQAVVDDMLQRIENSEGIERRGLVLATMTKLKQVCNHPAQFLRDGSRLAGRSGKLDALEEILDQVLAGGERALLFTQYAEFGAMLRGHLAGRFGREVLFLHGGVAKADRDTMVQRFQAADAASPPLFVLSLKAGGTGLTLTAANHVVHVDRWWNPAVEDQATDRAYRIGQRRSVQVRKFVCAGTVEEKIATMIRDKRGLAAKIVGASEGWLTELSTGQLAEMFRLEAGAVVE